MSPCLAFVGPIHYNGSIMDKQMDIGSLWRCVPVFIVLRRRHLILTGLLCCFFLAFSALLWYGSSVSTEVFSPSAVGQSAVVILDPGHGGEDGGAVAGDGTVESGVNLEIALRLRDLLVFTGQPVIMTRSEDVSIYSPGADTLREKKVSDLRNRVALVNGTEGAVLVSIHQNSLPTSPVTHGAQVFWNREAGAEALAESVQQALNSGVNRGNEKQPAPIGDSVYLMNQITAPGILVECGFLSNPGETAQLKEEAYQLRLAAAIAAGCLAAEEPGGIT